MYEVELSYKQTIYSKLITKFSESGWEVCQVEYDENQYNKPGILAARLTQSAKRYGQSHIRSTAVDGKVYLINSLKG